MNREQGVPRISLKRVSLKILLLVLVCLAWVFLNPLGCSVIGFLGGIASIKGVEKELQKPRVYEPVARRLALYCQSDQNLFPKYLSYAWLPQELQNVTHGRASVTSNQAHVEFGGGFYHFGYNLNLDRAASTSATNVWDLFIYREGSQSPKHLVTLRLASNEHVSAAEIEQMASANLNDELKQGDESAWKSKVMMELRFDKTAEAAAICKDWVQQKPSSWLARFTYAHLRCRLGEADAASTEFTEWVKSRKNFAHCIYLALFEFREGRTNQALAGVRLALNEPFVEPMGTDGSKFYLGHNGALIAYLNGNYDLALAMCEKMLSDSRPEFVWRRKVLRLEAAIMLMKGSEVAAAEKMKRAQSSQDKNMTFSLEGMAESDNKLLNAIQKRDLAFVKNPANWSDEFESWFSPFETDETGIHGEGLGIPTPYPKTWKSDKLNPSE